MGGLKTNNSTLKAVGLFDKQSSGAGGSAVSNATLAEQQAQTVLLGQILAEVDYEHNITYGRDSLVYVAMVIDSATDTQYQGVDNTPPLGSSVPASSITRTNSNNNFYTEITISPLTVFPIVNFSFDATIVSCLINTGAITIEVYGDTINLLDTIILATGASSGDTFSYTYIYDNSVTNYTDISLRIYQEDTPGSITATYSNFNNIVDFMLLPLDETIVKRTERFHNDTLISITYTDYLDNPYTLLGTFIPDSRLTLILNSNNSPSHEELTNPSNVSYLGFKEINFLCEGAIDVTLNGNTITYPFEITHNATTAVVFGDKIKADVGSINTITFDGTGIVRVNITQ